jgi:hypothetical protein
VERLALAREPSEDAEVGVKLNAVDAADADRAESPIVLQAAELALDGDVVLRDRAGKRADCLRPPTTMSRMTLSAQMMFL